METKKTVIPQAVCIPNQPQKRVISQFKVMASEWYQSFLT